MATPHIEAKEEDIAKVVLMPGDPLRAKYIADNFLKNSRLINSVRNMNAYTGEYDGIKITVFPSGMGMPSMGIYSYELFKFYNVDTIIRIGSAGAYTEELKLYDLFEIESSYSESSFAKTQNNEEKNILYSNKEINNIIENVSKELGYELKKGTIHSSDVFYKENDNFRDLYRQYGCMACEMESFALFHNANALNKKAAAIVTISDNLVTHEATTSAEREKCFTNMMKVALETAKKLEK